MHSQLPATDRVGAARIVVVGGGYAGVTCASRLARELGVRADVVLVNASSRFSERIRMHQVLAGQAMPYRALAPLLERSGARFVESWVRSIDLRDRTVRCDEATLPFDHLVLASGSRAQASIQGADRFAEPVDAAANGPRLATRIQEAAARSGIVLVVGGGLTALETAAELAEAHPRLRVELVTRGGVLPGWPDAARRHAVKTLLRLGVSLRAYTAVTSISDKIVYTTKGALPFDVCVSAAGFTFGDLAREAGMAVNSKGQVLVDPYLRSTSHPFVFAAGDIAYPVADPGDPLPLGCKSAIPSGAHCAQSLIATVQRGKLEPFDFATPFFCLSLGRRNGIVQWPRGDRSDAWRLTGRLAALFKELVSRSTWWALALESRGWRAARWQKTGRVSARPVQLG